MKLLSEIRDIEIMEDTIDLLRQETLPLVLWGAGEIAKEIIQYLFKCNVAVSQVVVDDKYFQDNSFLLNYRIRSYSQLIKQYTSFNVIWANSNYERIATCKEMKGVEQVFYFFSVNYGIFEKTPMKFIEDNIEEFEEVADLFEDDLSIKNYLALLKTHISGNNKYVFDMFAGENNFFNNDIFMINQDEVLLDVGAYNGDTIQLFLNENQGRYRYIYALEPDKNNLADLKQFVFSHDLTKIDIADIGAWNKKGVLNFSANDEQISGIVKNEDFKNSNSTIQVGPLDEIFLYQEKITILKMNYYEGVYEAIEGSQQILQRHKPKLAITVGFDCNNIKRIPKLIKQIMPQYKLYLRFNRAMVSACTLYATVQ